MVFRGVPRPRPRGVEAVTGTLPDRPGSSPRAGRTVEPGVGDVRARAPHAARPVGWNERRRRLETDPRGAADPESGPDLSTSPGSRGPSRWGGSS